MTVERAWLPLERARLSSSGKTKLAHALEPRTPTIACEIEHRRREMLHDRSPLVDGTLGPASDSEQRRSVADACRVSRRGLSARLLHSLVEEYRPKVILELGTNVGISAAYLASGDGSVTTLEGSPYRLRLAERLHRGLGLEIDRVLGLFSDTLKPTLERLPPIEMAFIDGHHQYQPTLDYFQTIYAHAAPGCLFIFDDIRWSGGMRKAWRKLRADSRFEAVADLGSMGVCIARGHPGSSA
jgi:predicted O-methyltransferase YrrM